MAISQRDLNVGVKTFVTNGQHPDCRGILVPIGYDAERLAAGEALLERWLRAKATMKERGKAQMLATQAEQAAERAAQLEATALREAVRTLWMDDESTLALFDLVDYRRTSSRPAQRPNGATGESHDADNLTPSEATKKEDSSPTNGQGWVSDYRLRTPERVARWRVLLAMVDKLDEAKQAELATYGWDAAHVARALSLVEAYVLADAVQQQKVKAVEASRAAAKQAEQALRRWYTQAGRLTRSAIKRRVPPEQQAYMRGLLGV